MNGLEEIQENIKKFVYDKKKIQQQITEIEEIRTQLAEQRNEKKKSNSSWTEINEFGKRITDLGNQSQELQNKLDLKFYAMKNQTNLAIDNLIAEGIRKIRKIDENDARTELEIIQLKKQIESDIIILAETKRCLKNGEINTIIRNYTGDENNSELIEFEEMQPIEEITIEEFEPIEELYVEEFAPIEELHIEEFSEQEEINKQPEKIVETIKEKDTMDEIEELARKIVEEIVAEQTKNNNVIQENVQEATEEITPDDIITFESENESEKQERVIIPLFGEKATISNIIVKFEDGELVYKAQMSDEKEIEIYPSRIGEENVLLRDKQSRQECKEILTNYAIKEYRILDKKVVNKIDPLVCELLIECAERYRYNAQELVYNYAMSFSNDVENDDELVPTVIYNLSYIEQSNLTAKEKRIINKICKNAKKNNKIDIIESFSTFKKIKYVFKRLFAVNNVKVLPEAKY